jgi:hypothetical protein
VRLHPKSGLSAGPSRSRRHSRLTRVDSQAEGDSGVPDQRRVASARCPERAAYGQGNSCKQLRASRGSGRPAWAASSSPRGTGPNLAFTGTLGAHQQPTDRPKKSGNDKGGGFRSQKLALCSRPRAAVLNIVGSALKSRAIRWSVRGEIFGFNAR